MYETKTNNKKAAQVCCVPTTRQVAVLFRLKPLVTRNNYPWTFNTGSLYWRTWQSITMAFDVKSRAKRYEKLDFLGEGQVGSEKHRCFLVYVALCSFSAALPRSSFVDSESELTRWSLMSTKPCVVAWLWQFSLLSISKCYCFCPPVCHSIQSQRQNDRHYSCHKKGTGYSF